MIAVIGQETFGSTVSLTARLSLLLTSDVKPSVVVVNLSVTVHEIALVARLFPNTQPQFGVDFQSVGQVGQLYLLMSNMVHWNPLEVDFIRALVEEVIASQKSTLHNRWMGELTRCVVGKTLDSRNHEAYIQRLEKLREVIVSEDAFSSSPPVLTGCAASLLLSDFLFLAEKYDKAREVLVDSIARYFSDSPTSVTETHEKFFLFNLLVNSSEGLRATGMLEQAAVNCTSALKLVSEVFPTSLEEQTVYTAIVNINLASVFQLQGDVNRAMKVLNSCVSQLSKCLSGGAIVSFKSKARRLLAQSLNNLSTCCAANDDLEGSLRHALDALKINEEEYTDKQAAGRLWVGEMLFQAQQSHPPPVNTFRQSKIASTVEHTEIATNLLNIAMVYSSLDLPQNAMTYATRAESMLRNLNEKRKLAVCLSSIATIFNEDALKARDYLEKAAAIFEELSLNATPEAVTTRISLARVLLAANKQKPNAGYTKEAVEQAALALSCITKEAPKDLHAASAETLSDAHKADGNTDKAIDFLYDAIQIYQELKSSAEAASLFDETLLNAYSNMIVMWQEKEDSDEANYYLKKMQALEEQINRVEAMDY